MKYGTYIFLSFLWTQITLSRNRTREIHDHKESVALKRNFPLGNSINLALLFFVLHSFGLYSQVGIGTTSPNASLDVSASNTSTPQNNEGILIPRVDNFPISNPTANQDGMLVFVTGNGTPSKGFYYWDNALTNWVLISGTTGGGGGNTLDQAYDQNGAGLGRTIIATDGAVRINGEDGFLVTGSFGSGNIIDNEVTGSGTRMFFNPNKAAFRAGTVNGDQWDDVNTGNYSVAIGNSATASATGSIALGLFTEASGIGSVAFGQNNIANQNFATAFGFQNTASASNATAFGIGNSASSDSSTAFGNSNIASGFTSTAFGFGSTASGDDSTAFGFNTAAQGYNATSFGNGTVAFGDYSTSFGFNTSAFGFISIAGGSNSIAGAQGAVAIGNNVSAIGNNSVAFGASTFADGGFFGCATAFGNQTSASNIYTTAFGQLTQASGVRSTAFGSQTMATGPTSTAFGAQTLASGGGSTAFGGITEASGNTSTAFGHDTLASGDFSTASGFQSVASGTFANASGTLTLASGSASFAMGSNTIASGVTAFSSGISTTSSGDAASAFGVSTLAPSYAETAIGTYNTTYTPASAFSSSNQDRLFVIGNGTSPTTTSNAITVYKSGLLNINDAYDMPITDGNAGQVMTTDGNGVVSFQNVNLTPTVYTLNQSYSQGGTGNGRIINAIYGPVEIQNTGGFIVSSLNQPHMLFVDGANDEVGIGTNAPTADFSVNGTANKPGGGTWAVFSDKRLKHNISNYKEGLELIMKVNPVNFSYNKTMSKILGANTFSTTKVFQGVIAQELQKIAPEMVREVEVGNQVFLEVDPNRFTYALINAMKEQQQVIEKQNERIQRIENKLKTFLDASKK